MSRTILIRVMALGLGLITGLLAVEGILRLTNPWIGRHSDTMFTVIQHDPGLGWKMAPGIVTAVDFVDREAIPVSSNRWGFWDDEWSQAKTPGRCRVVCLGDSFTWGMGVAREERFSDRLQAEDDRLEVMNLGIPGYGTDQSLLAWRTSARPFHPDLVVLTVFQNDFHDNLFQVLYGRAKPYFVLGAGGLELFNSPAPTSDFWQNGIMHELAPPYRTLFSTPTFRRNRLVHWMAKNSDVARLLYTLSRVWTRAELETDRTPEPHLGDQERAGSLSRFEEEQVRLLNTLVEQLNREILDQGARLLVVFAGHWNLQFQASSIELRERGIPQLDATTAKLASETAGRPVYYPFNQHWTPEAHRALAGLLAGRLKELACSPHGSSAVPLLGGT